MKKEFLHKQVPKSVPTLHFSELVCVKMVIFIKFGKWGGWLFFPQILEPIFWYVNQKNRAFGLLLVYSHYFR